MPVSGNEKPGIECVSERYSASIAGIPIKKRRFPLVRSPSPPPEEQISHRNLSQESCHSNAGVVTSSSGLSDASKNYFAVERMEISADKNVNLIQSDANLSGVNPQEPSPRIESGCTESVASKEKLMPVENTSGQIVSGNKELQLASNEALSLHVGNEKFSELKMERDYEPQVSTFIGSSELTLGPKEPFAPSFSGQNSEGAGQFLEKIGSVSLNLSLSKEKSSTDFVSGKHSSDIDGTHLRANRSNWDLNTTMDAWDPSMRGDEAAGQVTVGISSVNVNSGAKDTKPFILSDGIVVAGDASGNQLFKGRKPNPNITVSSNSPGQHFNFEDSLHLQLSPCLQPIISGEQSGSSAKIDTARVIPNSNMSTVIMPTRNPNMAVNVKSEPFDDSIKLDFKGSKDNLENPIDLGTIKRELIERLDPEALKLLDISMIKLDPRFIKSEPVHEGNPGTHNTAEGASRVSGVPALQCLDDQSYGVVLPKSTLSCASELSTCSPELRKNGNVSTHSGNSSCTKGIHVSMDVPQDVCNSIKQQVSSETVSVSEVRRGKELNTADVHAPGMVENLTLGDPEQCGLKLMEEASLCSCGDGGNSTRDGKRSLEQDGEGSERRGGEEFVRGDGEGPVSDEEKINISTDMHEDSYESDYESDGNHDLGTSLDAQQLGGEDDDDYEDGEVREPLVHTDVCPVSENSEAVVNCCDTDLKNVGFLGSTSDDYPASLQTKEIDTKTEDPGETKNDVNKESLDAVPDEKIDKVTEKDACFENSAIGKILNEPVKNVPIKPIRRKPLDRSGQKEVSEAHEPQLSSDKAVSGSQGTAGAFDQGIDQSTKGPDSAENNESALLKTEVSLSSSSGIKDANSGGARSRIINLPRASYFSSSCKTRSVSGRSLPSRTVRERFNDFVPEGDKLHTQGRDEIYIDGSHKFLRERNQDQALRNSRLSFTRGRGRGSSRLDALHGDWDCDHDFVPELYNGPTDFRFRRHKADVDADLECGSYIIAPNGAVGSGRGVRKPIDDELAIFRHPSSRRRSPGGREGPAAQGHQMLRRISRNISPSRCIGEDSSDLVGLRHSEKFIRGLRDDIVEPVFSRQQPPFEGVEGHFVQGNRNFSSIQRRGPPRIRSKSPMRSGSPGTWSSPRRRSPDGFNGHPELSHRRSPALYRMRSPDRTCFPEEIMARRHGSPPYLPRPSNDLREMDSSRDHGPPRTVITNRRSPSGRMLLRNSRRFDIIESRERTDGDEFFGPSVHSGRFHELGGDVSGEERRRIAERRGAVRSFRAPYNGAGGEGFRFNIEDAPRPYRFCPEADSDFHERGNLREREFDRRIKNRPGNAPRRNTEDQDGNYRHGEQVWQDQGFDDIPRLKRRKF